jgi:hypothetical protein
MIYAGPRPIKEQIGMIAETFHLSPDRALWLAKNVFAGYRLPRGAEGLFAIPDIGALTRVSVREFEHRHYAATIIVLECLAQAMRRFENTAGLNGGIRMYEATRTALDMIAAEQKSDILIIPGQFGRYRRNLSVGGVRETVASPEFPAHSIGVAAMLLSHPDRMTGWRDLWIDVPGEDINLATKEERAKGTAQWAWSPAFVHGDTANEITVCAASVTHAHYGSATFFLPF